MSRYFKKKKRLNSNIFFILIFIFIISLISCNFFSKFRAENVSIVLNSNYFNKNKLIHTIKNKVTNNINNPKELIKKKLSNYKIEVKQKKIESTFKYKENDNVLVYIYNSHQGEKYAYKYLEDYNIIPDVKMVAHMIEDNLNKIGIKAVVEDSNILDYMKDNGYNHAQSYIASRVFLEEAIKKYPKALLYIDLHRDAATHKVTYTEIEGKGCAKVLFVIGLENNNYRKNLEVEEKINNIIKNRYPNLTRGIMKKKGPGVNGIYNQDIADNVILLEVGGNENNIDELINTTNLMSNVIGEYINEKKEK